MVDVTFQPHAANRTILNSGPTIEEHRALVDLVLALRKGLIALEKEVADLKAAARSER